MTNKRLTEKLRTQGPDTALLRWMPHRPPFLLLDKLETFGAASVDAECGATRSDGVFGQATLLIRSDNPLVNAQGKLEPVAFAEMLAQCFAAASGAAAENAGSSDFATSEGYLAALRDVHVLGQACVGDRLSITVRVTATLGQVSVVEGEVRCGEALLARGQCKIFVTES